MMAKCARSAWKPYRSADADPAAQLLHVDLALAPHVPADHVLVVRVFGQVVQRDAIVEMGVRDEAEILEQLEGAIDRRDVHLGELGRTRAWTDSAETCPSVPRSLRE